MRELGMRLRGWVRAEMGAGRGMNGWGRGVGLAEMALGLGRGLEIPGKGLGFGHEIQVCFPDLGSDVRSQCHQLTRRSPF